MYGAYRPADETNVNTHWRLAQLVMPCWVIPPAAMLEDQIMIKGYIPMDDTHTMVYTIMRASQQKHAARTRTEARSPASASCRRARTSISRTRTDWFGRWRLTNDPGNDWLIDREAQRNGGIFSGITGLNVQDAAVGGMLGILSDRTMEL